MHHTFIDTGKWIAVGWAACLTVGMGCTQEKPLPPVAYTGPTLTAADLAVEPVRYDQTGYVLMESEPSQGRFPTSIAVARLVPADPGPFAPEPQRDWWVGTIAEEKATYWTALFNTFPAVRDVVVLDRRSLSWPDVELTEIVAAAGQMDAALCVIWGPAPTEPGHAGLVGVVMDTARRQAVALVRAEAGPQDILPPAPDQMEGDQRHEDVNYLAARKFQAQVQTCLRALIQRDRPRSAPQSNPWESVDPTPIPVYIVPTQSVTP